MPIKFRVRISETAESDFFEAWGFIREDSPEAAVNFLLQWEKQVSTLETFPSRCPLISENDLIGAHYRRLIYGDYRVIFRIEARIVYVVRIIQAARLLDASALEGE
jgi:plasmid stabilization system protein ParE